jgi:hypothetical protein
MKVRILAILCAAIVFQPVMARADWLDDVPAAAGLRGCKRDGPEITGWHCTGYDGPRFNPRTGEMEPAKPRSANPQKTKGG